MIGTLADFKTRLGITDDAADGELTGVLSAASQKVLALCGYTETDTTGVVEVFRNVQQGREKQLKIRKVVDDATFQVEGRGHGTSLQLMAKDLLDPADGVWMILGSAEWWPPNYVEERRPRFRKWREPVWPVVKVTYNVTGIADAGTPDELIQGVYRLASFWRALDRAAASTKIGIGTLTQEMSTAPLPKDLRSILGSHYRGGPATWTA